MKILFLTLDTFSRTGGIQQFNRSFQLALAQWAGVNGGEVMHCSLVDRDGDAMPRYTPDGALQFRGFAWNKLQFLRFFLGHAGQYDLVVFGHVNLVPLALTGQKKPGQKYWLVTHGVEVWGPLNFFRRKGLARMDKMLSVSRFTMGQVQEAHGFPASKMELFPNCLDPFFAEGSLLPESVWNKDWRLKANRTYILTLARLSATEQAKGYDLVIRLLPRLAGQYPDIGYLLAGKWEDGEYARIRALAETLGVADRVLMPGFVKPECLPSLYNLAKVFVMPSSKEGFGIVFLEAAWWGCPVVAGQGGGAAEALPDGVPGSLVDPQNEEVVFAAVSSCLSNEKPLMALPETRKLIDAHFGFSAFSNRLHLLLKPGNH